jgi:para-aminobenzoate synthetase component 1
LLSSVKAIFSGESWNSQPTELSECLAVLEIHSLADWHMVNAFLHQHKEQHIGYLLSHQLKGIFPDFKQEKHPNMDFPLAVFCAFQKAAEYVVPTEFQQRVSPIELKSRISKEHYLNKISIIKDLIQKGEFYETNFCFEHYCKGEIAPQNVFRQVNKLSKAPFSAHFQYQQHHVISGSPELFFETENDKIRCAPIKGTRPRGLNAEEDLELKLALEKSLKERAENIMIVDLVRHDLSQIAVKNSVSVEALCKVHTFETVHQLITDITAKARSGIGFTDMVEKLFPIGSMTGAPKISAVSFTDNLEPTPRVTYSGSLGWIKPNGNIISSVLIRGIYYDALQKYVSVSVGGAITALSQPEEEYEECQTKLRMMQEALRRSQ